MQLSPGTAIDRYVVEGLLGRGGMASVYLAEHVAVGRQLAVKILHRDQALQPDVLVKGGDYDAKCTDAMDPRYIVGSAEVRANGGRVETISLVPGRSTTAIADRLKG